MLEGRGTEAGDDRRQHRAAGRYERQHDAGVRDDG